MKLNKSVKLIALTLTALIAASCGSGGESSSTGGNETGQAGSTARMVINDNYLYAIAGNSVQLFDITAAQSPLPWVKVPIQWDIETLFPYGDYLLIGAETGMHIMDNTDPANPTYIAEFTHARARDPVVAHNGYAYVTLKSDGFTFGAADQMDVINLADITNPTLVRTLPMQSPSGLSVENTRLYVCDGIAGLKIFDVTESANPTFVETIREIDCNDVIARQNILYVITDDGLAQYDATASPPVLISTL